jgi:SnoaL-like polyketide cyclase
MPTVSELNKDKVKLFIEAVWNDGRLELIDELVAADHLGHVSCLRRPVEGPEGVRRLVSSRRLAYPDLYVKIEERIAEYDLVAIRWRATAGLDAARPVIRSPECWSGISVIRLLAGKQVEAHTAVAPPHN